MVRGRQLTYCCVSFYRVLFVNSFCTPFVPHQIAMPQGTSIALKYNFHGSHFGHTEHGAFRSTITNQSPSKSGCKKQGDGFYILHEGQNLMSQILWALEG